MKAASAPFIALLASNQFVMADLLTITLIDNSVYRYTSADIDLSVGGNLFSSQTIKFKRGATRIVTGVQVDTLELNLYADGSMLLGGIPFLAAVHNGALDGAKVLLQRTFMATWGDTSAGSIIPFSGRVAESKISRTEAILTVKSDLELLNINMPRNLYMPGCIHTLYDSGCGFNPAAAVVNYSVTSASSKLVIYSAATQATGHFDQGVMKFNSGANTGVKRTIKSYQQGVNTVLSYPLPNTPTVGDAFSMWPGCDKTQTMCQNKFANIANFRGFPYIPTPEVAL